MAQGRSSYQPEEGLHHHEDPNAQFTTHQAPYEFMDDLTSQYLKAPNLLDQLISTHSGTHGQSTHAGTTPTLISSPGNQSATASSAYTSPHLTTPPTSYDHQSYANNASLLPLFSSTSASSAPQGGHASLGGAFEQTYSASSSNSTTYQPPPYAPIAGPSRPRSLSPPSAHPQHLLNTPIVEDYEMSINSILSHSEPKDVESRLRDYNGFAYNPQLQLEWLRVIYNWVVRQIEPSRDDHFHFLEAHHAPISQKTGGPGSRGGAQSYTCLWPDCGKELKSRADRAQEHVLEHLDIKPYHCENCGNASFLRKNDCSRHEKTCKTASTSSRVPKRKTGPRGTAPYPEINTRRATATNTRTSSPNASRSASDSPLARMNLVQMASPLHMTSPLSPSSLSPQTFFIADAVPSSSPTTTTRQYAEAQLHSPLLRYPLQLPTASSSMPVPSAPTHTHANIHNVNPNAGPLLFQHHHMPIHSSSYPMTSFAQQFDVQRSLPYYPHSNGSNDSFIMPMQQQQQQGTPDSHHQQFPHM